MEEKFGIVYIAENEINLKPYVGITIRELEVRKKKHFRDARSGSHFHFHCGIRKYGEDAFKWRILEDNIPESRLKDREELWIAYYNSYYGGYNSTEGGYSNPWNNPEIRNKMIEQRNNEEYRKQQSEKAIKQWEDLEARKKQSERFAKQWEDPEFRKKKTESSIKQWEDPELRKQQSQRAIKQWEDPETLDKISGDNHYTKRPGYVSHMLGDNNPAKRPEVQAKRLKTRAENKRKKEEEEGQISLLEVPKESE